MGTYHFIDLLRKEEFSANADIDDVLCGLPFKTVTKRLFGKKLRPNNILKNVAKVSLLDTLVSLVRRIMVV